MSDIRNIEDFIKKNKPITNDNTPVLDEPVHSFASTNIGMSFRTKSQSVWALENAKEIDKKQEKNIESFFDIHFTGIVDSDIRLLTKNIRNLLMSNEKKNKKWFIENGELLFNAMEVFYELCMKTNHGLFDEDKSWGNDIQSKLEDFFDFEECAYENNLDATIEFSISEIIKFFSNFEEFIDDKGIIMLNVGVINVLNSLSSIILMINSCCDNFHVLEVN